ncbi:MAG: O-antigen ligase family protein [Methylocystis sp.]
MFVFVSAFGLLSCLLLGGGTREGFLSDAILQLISVPIFLAALWRILDAPLNRDRRRALAFCAAIVAVPLIQLAPLPPAIWTRLPGRAIVAESFQLLGRSPLWAPISMAPEATWLAALSLLPPFSIFLAVVTLDRRDRRRMSYALIVFGVVSVFLGLIQLAQGQTSALRFYEITNADDPVGFFANRNHFSALLYCSMLLAAAALAPRLAALSPGPGNSRRGIDASSARGAVGVIVAGVALVVLIAGEVIARSRAGAILAAIALALCFIIDGERRRILEKMAFSRALAAIVVLAIVLLGQSTLSRLLDRFDADPLADARLVFARTTIRAAKSVTPVGAGLGSFPSFYMTFERPADLQAGVYANHAHNDFLELWLETGLIGPILLGLFLVWLARKAVAAWTAPDPGLPPVDRPLAQASILVILLLFGHSLVDYPLRTGAMMAVFAFCCGVLIDPPPVSCGALFARRRKSTPTPSRRLQRE